MHDLSILLESGVSSIEREIGLEIFARLPLYRYTTVLIMPVIKTESETGIRLRYLQNYKKLTHDFTGNDLDYLQEGMHYAQFGASRGKPYTTYYRNVAFVSLDAGESGNDDYMYSVVSYLNNQMVLFMCPESKRYDDFFYMLYSKMHSYSMRGLAFRGRRLHRTSDPNRYSPEERLIRTAISRSMKKGQSPSYQSFVTNGNSYDIDRIKAMPQEVVPDGQMQFTGFEQVGTDAMKGFARAVNQTADAMRGYVTTDTTITSLLRSPRSNIDEDDDIDF